MRQIGDKVSYVRNPFARNSYYCLTLAVLGLAVGTASMCLSVARAGQGGRNTGAAALMGLWYGARSFMEKDRNYILAKIGISISVVLVIVWAVIIITGIVR